jgi:hypothetical protein
MAEKTEAPKIIRIRAVGATLVESDNTPRFAEGQIVEITPAEMTNWVKCQIEVGRLEVVT